MSGGFLTAVTMSGPADLTFEVTIVPAGQVAVGELTTLPGIAGDVTLKVRGPDGKTEPVTLPQLTLDPSGKIEFRQGSGATADLDEARSAEHAAMRQMASRSEEHTSELQSQSKLVCRPLLECKTWRTSMST